MLVYLLCFALVLAIIFWLLMEIKSLQKEVSELEDECIRAYEALDKSLKQTKAMADKHINR